MLGLMRWQKSVGDECNGETRNLIKINHKENPEHRSIYAHE